MRRLLHVHLLVVALHVEACFVLPSTSFLVLRNAMNDMPHSRPLTVLHAVQLFLDRTRMPVAWLARQATRGRWYMETGESGGGLTYWARRGAVNMWCSVRSLLNFAVANLPLSVRVRAQIR